MAITFGVENSKKRVRSGVKKKLAWNSEAQKTVAFFWVRILVPASHFLEAYNHNRGLYLQFL